MKAIIKPLSISCNQMSSFSNPDTSGYQSIRLPSFRDGGGAKIIYRESADLYCEIPDKSVK